MPLFRQDEFLWGQDAKRIIELEENMGRLRASEDWKALAAIGAAQRATRIEMLLSPRLRPEGPSDDFLKGAIYGIQLLLETPGTIMQQAQEIHNARAKDLNNE